jgi:hypothetical protein
MFGSVVILVKSYQYTILIPLLSYRIKTGAYTFIVVVFGGIGLYLVAAGLMSPSGSFITPFYNQINNLIAGLLALSGAVAMSWEKYDTPHQIMP